MLSVYDTIEQPALHSFRSEFMLPTQAVTYQELVDGFEWHLPAQFNIANACCDRHARERPKKPAIIVDNGLAAPTIYTFAQLNTLSDRLAGHFAEFGIQQGDRIALSLPQGVEAISVMLAIFKRAPLPFPSRRFTDRKQPPTAYWTAARNCW